MAQRAEQTRRMANRTHTKTVHKPPAAQWLAISRVRHNGIGILERERLVATPCSQNRPGRARRLHGGVGLLVWVVLS